MLKKYLNLFILFLIPFAIYGNGSPENKFSKATSDPVWQDAVLLFEFNWDWVAGKIEMTVQQLDDNNKIKSSTEMIITNSIAEDGSVKSNFEGDNPFESFLSNNEDMGKMIEGMMENLSDEQKEQIRERMGGDFDPEQFGQMGQQGMRGNLMSTEGTDISPFDPALQELVSIYQTEEEKKITGKICVVYEFMIEGDKESEGRVWIEKETGIPIKVDIKIKKLPRGIKNMQVETYYMLSENSDWYASSRIVTQVISFGMFQSQNIRNLMNFKEYFLNQ